MWFGAHLLFMRPLLIRSPQQASRTPTPDPKTRKNLCQSPERRRLGTSGASMNVRSNDSRKTVWPIPESRASGRPDHSENRDTHEGGVDTTADCGFVMVRSRGALRSRGQRAWLHPQLQSRLPACSDLVKLDPETRSHNH